MLLYIGIIFITVLGLVAYMLYSSLDKKVIYKHLKNKHVVITGGSSGIGKTAAMEAAKLGAHVTVLGRDIQKLSTAVDDIKQNCMDQNSQKIQYAALDVTSDYKAIEKCFSNLEESVGPIFMLVNCAGMCICGRFEDMEPSDIKHMIDLNYFGTAYCTKYVLPGMKKRNEGLIVFVASEAAFIGKFNLSTAEGLR